MEVDATHEDVKAIVDKAVKLAEQHPITLPAEVSDLLLISGTIIKLPCQQRYLACLLIISCYCNFNRSVSCY